MPRSVMTPFSFWASTTTAPAPSPNRTQVERSSQSRMRENASAPMTRARLNMPALQIVVGGGQGENEARAYRLHVEGRALGDAELGLDGHGGGGKGLVRGRGGEDDQVDVFGCEPRIIERRARGNRAHGRGELAFGGDAAFLEQFFPLNAPKLLCTSALTHLLEHKDLHSHRRHDRTKSSPKASTLRAFLTYAVGPTGQAFGPPIGYPALPASVVAQSKKLIAEIK